MGIVMITREGDKGYMSSNVIEDYVGEYVMNQDGTIKKDENGNDMRFIYAEEAKAGLEKALIREAKKFDQYLDKDFEYKMLFGGFEDDENKDPNRKDNDKLSAEKLVDLMSSLCSDDVSDLGIRNS